MTGSSGFRRRIRPVVLATALALSGCAGVTDRGSWGGAAGWPDGEGLKKAALDSARDPETWAPLLAALVLSIGDLDEDLSDWAADEKPLFGGDAKQVSDDLRDAALLAYGVTALLAPSDRVGDKAKGLAVGAVTLTLEREITSGLKSLTDRERPDGSNERSFPSGHATRASVAATLAMHNLDYIAMPRWAEITSRAGLYGVAAGTAWARVEAEKHYVTDVLAGYALGHFFASFMNRAFLEAARGEREAAVAVRYQPVPGGAALRFEAALGR